MSVKQLNKNFGTISEEKLREINGGKMKIRETLLNIVDFIDSIKDIAIEKEFDMPITIPFYYLLKDRQKVNQD